MFTNKKRAAVDTEWVDANIIAHLPTKSIENVEPLRVSIETWNRMKAVKDLPSLTAKTLHQDEVCAIFQLIAREHMDDEFGGKKLFDVPEELELAFNMIHIMLEAPSPLSKPISQWFVNLVIFKSFLEEKVAIQTDSGNVSPLCLNQVPALKFGSSNERELNQIVAFEHKLHVLHGAVHGYAHYGSELGDFLVMKATKRFQLRQAYGQLLSCMAMMHQMQKKEKDHAIVFGIATDGCEFRFWRIDSGSNVSSSSIYHWKELSERVHIYSIFRAIIRVAISLRPTTSQVKSQEVERNYRGIDHPGFFLSSHGTFTTDLLDGQSEFWFL